jgi:hypothetical protein
MEMRPGKQEGLTPSVFRFGLIGMFGISEPGRDSSPLTGLTTIPAHCSLNNTAIEKLKDTSKSILNHIANM